MRKINNGRTSLICFILLTMGLATQAQAQLVTYQYTGTLIGGTDGIGNTISGSITLDVGATPDYSSGGYAQWIDGDFSIDGTTDSGVTAGPSLGGTTRLDIFDYGPDNVTVLARDWDNENGYGILALRVDNDVMGDGIANVPNPWNPLAAQRAQIDFLSYDPVRGTFEVGSFTLDTFVLDTAPSTITIDGFDTGIQDFEYEGQFVSEHLADCADDAKNHGAYVSCVAKLTNKLKKAGLLTGAQKDLIMSYAAKSSIGK
jgi:hypothetical protein